MSFFFDFLMSDRLHNSNSCSFAGRASFDFSGTQKNIWYQLLANRKQIDYCKLKCHVELRYTNIQNDEL